jgi:hypothetical protein
MIVFSVRIHIAAMALVLAAVLPAGLHAGKIKEDPKGFNGYMLGSSLSDYSSLKLIQDLGSTDFVSKAGVYEKPGETMTLNGVPIRHVGYRFIDEQLESIQLQYEGRENRDQLLLWLEDRFGRVSASERKMVTAVQWFGEYTTVTLSYNPRTHHGTLWFMSQTLNHRFNEFHQGSQGD